MSSAPYPDHKIGSLESIRGLAALLVVLHHVPDWNGTIHDVRFLRNGYLLVDLFFVLSGFVIYNAYAGKLETFKQLVRFQFLRFGRLYPVHLLFLLVFVLIELSKYVAQSRYAVAMPNTAPFRESNGVAFIEQVFLVQAIGPTGNALTFNTAAWSISVEFYTYLVFGLTVLLAPRLKHVLFTLLVAGSVLLLVNRTTFGSTDLVRCIAGFFTGCLTALAAQRWKIRCHPAVAVLAFLGLIVFLSLRVPPSWNSVTYLLTSVLVLALATTPRGGLNSLLELKVLTWLGTISYSIYMSHPAVIWAFNQVLRIVLKRPVLLLEDRMTPQLPLAAAAVSYVLLVAAVLLLSHFTYAWVEAPWRNKSRQADFPKHFTNRR